MTSFEPIFVPEALRDAVSDAAWVEAMLEVERALANAESLAGVIPASVATEIADACRADLFDAAAIVEAGRLPGNPAEPLVRGLRARLTADAARHVHFGATSQDIVDSAAMLVARKALELIGEELTAVVDLCGGLARAYRDAPMAARTLLQQAVPTTFGCKAAGWAVAVHSARGRLAQIEAELPASLGGAAGTLAPLGGDALEVTRLFAAELELAEPVVPWHTNRLPVADLGSALAATAGVLAKIGLDVVLLAQTEVGEVTEAESGASSALPQKRNPIGATLARACERRVRANAGMLLESLVGEHERAAGAWHAEWGALSEALAYTGGAAAAIHRSLDGLEVDTARMRANLDLTHGGIAAERLAVVLAEALGRTEAHELVRAASLRSAAEGISLGEAISAGTTELSSEQIAVALDPATYLGSAGAFVDRALALVEAAT